MSVIKNSFKTQAVGDGDSTRTLRLPLDDILADSKRILENEEAKDPKFKKKMDKAVESAKQEEKRRLLLKRMTEKDDRSASIEDSSDGVVEELPFSFEIPDIKDEYMEIVAREKFRILKDMHNKHKADRTTNRSLYFLEKFFRSRFNEFHEQEIAEKPDSVIMSDITREICAIELPGEFQKQRTEVLNNAMKCDTTKIVEEMDAFIKNPKNVPPNIKKLSKVMQQKNILQDITPDVIFVQQQLQIVRDLELSKIIRELKEQKVALNYDRLETVVTQAHQVYSKVQGLKKPLTKSVMKCVSTLNASIIKDAHDEIFELIQNSKAIQLNMPQNKFSVISSMRRIVYSSGSMGGTRLLSILLSILCILGIVWEMASVVSSDRQVRRVRLRTKEGENVPKNTNKTITVDNEGLQYFGNAVTWSLMTAMGQSIEETSGEHGFNIFRVEMLDNKSNLYNPYDTISNYINSFEKKVAYGGIGGFALANNYNVLPWKTGVRHTLPLLSKAFSLAPYVIFYIVIARKYGEIRYNFSTSTEGSKTTVSYNYLDPGSGDNNSIEIQMLQVLAAQAYSLTLFTNSLENMVESYLTGERAVQKGHAANDRSNVIFQINNQKFDKRSGRQYDGEVTLTSSISAGPFCPVKLNDGVAIVINNQRSRKGLWRDHLQNVLGGLVPIGYVRDCLVFKGNSCTRESIRISVGIQPAILYNFVPGLMLLNSTWNNSNTISKELEIYPLQVMIVANFILGRFADTARESSYATILEGIPEGIYGVRYPNERPVINDGIQTNNPDFQNLIQKIDNKITLYGEGETQYGQFFSNDNEFVRKPIIINSVKQYFLVNDYDVNPKVCPVLKFSYNE